MTQNKSEVFSEEGKEKVHGQTDVMTTVDLARDDIVTSAGDGSPSQQGREHSKVKNDCPDKLNKTMFNRFESSDDSIYVIKPTAKRYIILIMYGICSMEKSFQWINLSSITNKVSRYYGVDNIAVNWTSVLFMMTFIPLVLPTSWLIERIGLRKAVLFGSGGLTLGAIIKCFSCGQDRFYIVIIGQIFVSLSEQFIFCIPARIASVWFPDHQVSLATGFGIFGNQCGIALGFLIPPALLEGLETREEIGVGLYHLFLHTAIVGVATMIVLVFLFEDSPKYAPGNARLLKKLEEARLTEIQRSFYTELREFGSVLKELIKDHNCKLLIVAFGINIGSGYAIQTLLNQLVTSSDFENSNLITGKAGLLIIFCGMVGALFWGHLCDLTHRYIMINKILYVGVITSLILFGLTLRWNDVWALYGASSLLGFFMIGYNAVGLDTIVELTYPAPELVSTSVMNLSPQVFGIGITFLSSALVDEYKSDAAITFLVCVLTVGLIGTYMVRETLARQIAVKETREERERIDGKHSPTTISNIQSSYTNC